MNFPSLFSLSNILPDLYNNSDKLLNQKRLYTFSIKTQNSLLLLFSGFIKHGEKASPYSVSIILMFTLFQFGYMVVLMIPTKLMFDYEFISAFYLIFIITYGIWLGASYYIQIFSQRYNSKFLTASNNNINSSLNNSSDKSD